MHIYLVVPGIRILTEQNRRFGARPNVLLSYIRAGNEFAHFLRTYRQLIGKIMLDSGAYSEMAGTITVELDPYASYLEACHDLFDHTINLDVDPKNYAVRNWNLAVLSKVAPNILPVVHDPYAGEINMLFDQGFHYILLGSSWGTDRKQLDFVFNRYVYSAKYPGIKFHKLGTATYTGLCEYPYYSSDSSGFIKQGGVGELLYWNPHSEPDPNGDCTDSIYFGGRQRSSTNGAPNYTRYPYLGELEDYLWSTFEFRLSDVEGESGAENRWIVNGKYVLDLQELITMKFQKENS